MQTEPRFNFRRTLIGHPPAGDPSSALQAALQSLRDIDGVYGSFILDEIGKPIARDLSGVFDDQTLAEAGERILRLWIVLSETSPPEYTMLEFAEYSLFVRGLFHGDRPAGCLCVVVPQTVNLLALRLAAKWVAKTFDRGPAPAAPPR